MNGAPAKIHRKHGRKVTQVVRIAPKVAATSGGSPVASRKAARKPTNCVTMISGPGVSHTEIDNWREFGGLSQIESLCVGIEFRSEEHTSELQSLMRISYAVFCLKKKNIN